MLECADGSFYIGWTNDLEKRVRTHNSGRGAKYTKSRLPVKLVYFEEYETEHEARSREVYMKRLTRREKEELKSGFSADKQTADPDEEACGAEAGINQKQ